METKTRTLDSGRAIEIVTLGLSSLVLLYFAWLNRGYELDDALIYFRYVQNCVSGKGLVYNPGEYFNGLTSPLYVFFLLGVSFLTGGVETGQFLLNYVLLGASGLIGYRILGRINLQRIVVLAFPLMLVTQFFFYKVWGMESYLYMMLLFLSVLLIDQNRDDLLFPVLGLLVLARGEGALLIVAVAVFSGKRYLLMKKWMYFLWPAALIFMNAAFNKLYYGAFLPQTLAAKIQQGNSGEWGGTLGFLRGFMHDRTHYFYDDGLYFGLILLLMATGLWALGKSRINRVILSFIALNLVFYTILKIPSYHWYKTPFYAFAIFYAAVGLGSIRNAVNQNLFIRRSVSVGVTFLVCYVLTIQCWGSFVLLQHAGPQYLNYKRIALWIERNTAPSSSLAAMEIGTLGYYSKRRMIDILGLVNPMNAELIGKGDYTGWLDHYRPDYILVRDPMHRLEVGGYRAHKELGYAIHPYFPFTGYALLVKPTDNPEIGH